MTLRRLVAAVALGALCLVHPATAAFWTQPFARDIKVVTNGYTHLTWTNAQAAFDYLDTNSYFRGGSSFSSDWWTVYNSATGGVGVAITTNPWQTVSGNVLQTAPTNPVVVGLASTVAQSGSMFRVVGNAEVDGLYFGTNLIRGVSTFDTGVVTVTQFYFVSTNYADVANSASNVTDGAITNKFIATTTNLNQTFSAGGTNTFGTVKVRAGGALSYYHQVGVFEGWRASITNGQAFSPTGTVTWMQITNIMLVRTNPQSWFTATNGSAALPTVDGWYRIGASVCSTGKVSVRACAVVTGVVQDSVQLLTTELGNSAYSGSGLLYANGTNTYLRLEALCMGGTTSNQITNCVFDAQYLGR